jgi:hypothetical protein
MHPFALTARPNYPCPFKVCQVARNVGLARFEDLNEKTDANLILSHEV